MIARVQSLYLLLVGLLAITSMFLPFWSFNAGHIFLISDVTPLEITDAISIFAAAAGRAFSPLTAAISVGAIFLYKNREMQRKFIMLAMLLFFCDIFAGLTVAHFMNEHFKSIGATVTHHADFGLVILLPEPILLLLAMKGVQKDEKIANAYKRL